METVDKVRLWNFLDDEEVRAGKVAPLEVEAMFDTGGTKVLLPPDIASSLRLVPRGSLTIQYADGREEEREAVYGLMIEVLGRVSNCRAFIEPQATQVHVGHIVMEDINVGIDVPNGRVVALSGPQGRSGYWKDLH